MPSNSNLDEVNQQIAELMATIQDLRTLRGVAREKKLDDQAALLGLRINALSVRLVKLRRRRAKLVADTPAFKQLVKDLRGLNRAVDDALDDLKKVKRVLDWATKVAEAADKILKLVA